MALETVNLSTEVKHTLKEIGRHINPHTNLTYGMIVDTLIAEYKEAHGIDE